MGLFGKRKPRPAFVRPHSSSDEFIRGALHMQMVNLKKIDALRDAGHLSGRPDPHRDFGGWPCWLRYERDGFYVDYAGGHPSWKIEPLPRLPIHGMCDGNGYIQIRTEDGSTWAYDALQQVKYFESGPAPKTEPLLGEDDPYQEIHMTEADHVAWVKSQRNPELWHLAAMAVVAYCGDSEGFLPWLVEQPELDRSTAAWIFLFAEGAAYLAGNDDYLTDIEGNSLRSVFDALCRRSERDGFRNDTLGLDPGFEKERQKCLHVLNQRQLAEGIVFPSAILKEPLKAPTHKFANHLDDGVIVA